jgi:general secretion pathway protein I
VSRRAYENGFSLLEVLVALAILGLGLTSILSAQAGLFSSSARSGHVTSASNLARCKLSEVEIKLLREGYQWTEQKGEGSCCDEEDESTYSCKWVVEPVVLPEMNLSLNMDGGVSPMPGASSSAGFLSGFNPSDTSGLGASPLGALGGLMPGLGGANAPFGMLSSGSGAGAGMGSLATMALSIVYPTLKPMLEASIRRITVSVKWNEGTSERNFDLVEYVTNPMQGLPPMGSASSGTGNPLLDMLSGLSGTGPATNPMATPGGH